jgi:hypothetical protein
VDPKVAKIMLSFTLLLLKSDPSFILHKLPLKVDLTEKNGMKIESHVMRDFHHFRRGL